LKSESEKLKSEWRLRWQSEGDVCRRKLGTEIKCAGYKIIIPARTDSSRRNYRWQSFNGHLRDTGKSHRKKEEAIHGCLSARQRFISVEGNAVWRAKYHLTHSNTRKT